MFIKRLQMELETVSDLEISMSPDKHTDQF